MNKNCSSFALYGVIILTPRRELRQKTGLYVVNPEAPGRRLRGIREKHTDKRGLMSH